MDSISRNYMSRFPQGMSKVKLVILLTLLDEGVGFPRGWVESTKLVYLTNQNNFHHHVNALMEEYGCDIETEYFGGQKSYRLKSADVLEIKPKATLEQTQKQALLAHANNACQVCSAPIIPGTRDLTVDNKIPSSRGGVGDLSNLQLICNECGVNKRRSCADCKDNCKICSWAFPENADSLMLIRLPQELKEKLKQTGVASPVDVEQRIIKLIEDSFIVRRPPDPLDPSLENTPVQK